MNPWLISAAAMLFALIPVGIRCFYGDPMDRLVALETAGVIVTLTLLLLAVGTNRLVFLDIALAAALLAFGGGLVFARFMERWF